MRKELANTLELFLCRELSREELISWADKTISSMFNRTKPLPIDNVAFKFFLFHLSDDNPYEMPTEEDIRDYYEVLTGTKNSKYSCFIKNICFTKEKEIKELEKFLKYYIQYEQFPDEYGDWGELDNLEYVDKNVQSVEDILYYTLLNLTHSLPMKFDHGVISNANAIFARDDEYNMELMLNKINTLIRCIRGEECFYTTVFFEAGNYKILFV